MGKVFTKGEVIDYIWQYSRYYGNLLIYCEQTAKDENGQASLIYLFNLTEIIFKSKVGDYDSGFKNIIEKLKQQHYINDTEYDFLNDQDKGIRRFRNLLAHANLSKYNVLFLQEEGNTLYPLTENETCTKLYNVFSQILFNLMLKVISPAFIDPISIDLNQEIQNIDIEIKEISAEQLLGYKGVNYSEIYGWNNMTEAEKYRLAENSQDVNVLTKILKGIL